MMHKNMRCGEWHLRSGGKDYGSIILRFEVWVLLKDANDIVMAVKHSFRPRFYTVPLLRSAYIIEGENPADSLGFQGIDA